MLPVGTDAAFSLGLFTEPAVLQDLREQGVPGAQVDALGGEGYVVVVGGNRVCLYGARPRSVLYAVYDFLREIGGCEFALSVEGVERVPLLQRLELKPVRRLERPAFPVRGFGFHTETCVDTAYHTRMIDWLTKLRFNRIQLNVRLWETMSGVLGPVLAERDLDLDLGIHSLNHFLPAAKFAEAHPDWYASVSNRFGRQLRFSNLDSVPAVAEAALRFLERTPQVKVLGLWPLDGTGFDPEEIASGEMGEHVLRYVNAVTERLTVARPDLVIDHLAYVGYVAPPKRTRPHPNVMTSVCHYWDQQFTQPICDAWYGRGRVASAAARERSRRNFSPCRTHADCCRDLAGWVRLGPAVVFSYYLDCNLSAQCVYDLERVIRTDLRYNRALGVKGGVACYCMNTDYLWFFRDVHLLAEFQWSPDADWARRDMRLMEAVFGRAGADMVRFFGCVEALHNEPTWGGFRLADLFRGFQSAYSLSGYNPDLHPAILEQVEARVDAAMRILDSAGNAAEDAVTRERVAGIRFNLAMQRAFARMGCCVLAAFGCRDLAAENEGLERAALEARALQLHDEALGIFNAWVAEVETTAPGWADLSGKIKAYRVALERDFRAMPPE